MVTVQAKKGNVRLNVSISQESASLMEKNGVSKRKRGEFIQALIMKEYAAMLNAIANQEQVPKEVMNEYDKKRTEIANQTVKAKVGPKCPECQIELTEYEGTLQCELCGYIQGETPEDRYTREQRRRAEKLKALG